MISKSQWQLHENRLLRFDFMHEIFLKITPLLLEPKVSHEQTTFGTKIHYLFDYKYFQLLQMLKIVYYNR